MQVKLLEWYEVHKRDLPWRENPTPYTIWVSEVMAQQTRIAQLLPFYIRFMNQFPDVFTLANADEEVVLATWAGMGYYSRARNLHRCAKIICDTYNGNFPQTRKAWEVLPGVGAYTAGAILSIVYGQQEAAVDGNVLRLYARLANDDIDINTAKAKQRATALITANMPNNPTQMSYYTQALMELGALVCTPKNPQCHVCPLVHNCEAHAKGKILDLPIKSQKKSPIKEDLMVLRIFSPAGKVLMRKRTEGLLHGMWVYYLINTVTENLSLHTMRDKITEYLKKHGYTILSMTVIGKARHTFTHRIWQMTGYDVHIKETSLIEDYQWLSPQEVDNIAVPVAMRYFF